MSAFEKMTADQILVAQNRLDDLCKKYKLEKFNIQEKDGLICWRQLVQAMCGVDIKHREAPGRKRNSDALVDDVRRLDALYTEFSRLEIVDDKDKTKETTYNQLPDFRRKQIYGFIAESLSKSYGRKITAGKVKGILNNEHNEDQLERLAKDEFKELEEASFDPDDMPEA